MKNCHRSIGLTLVLAGMLALQASSASALSFTLRSGTPGAPNLDPSITYLAEPSGGCGVGFAAAFTAADFAAAVAGPSVLCITPISVWNQALVCDAAAGWISTPPARNPVSALYAQHFYIPAPCCISKARLSFCWTVDDFLGDYPVSTPNGAGVYINGVALPTIFGGNYAVETTVGGVDISSLVHCGDNVMYVYDRDAGCSVAGVIYSATIDVTTCLTPSTPNSWGSIRKIYR